MLKQIYHNV